MSLHLIIAVNSGGRGCVEWLLYEYEGEFIFLSLFMPFYVYYHTYMREIKFVSLTEKEIYKKRYIAWYICIYLTHRWFDKYIFDIKRTTIRANRNFISPPISPPIYASCYDNNRLENMPGIYPQLIILLNYSHVTKFLFIYLYIFSF